LIFAQHNKKALFTLIKEGLDILARVEAPKWFQHEHGFSLLPMTRRS